MHYLVRIQYTSFYSTVAFFGTAFIPKFVNRSIFQKSLVPVHKNAFTHILMHTLQTMQEVIVTMCLKILMVFTAMTFQITVLPEK